MIRTLLRFSLRLTFWSITMLGVLSALVWLMNLALPRIAQTYLKNKTGFEAHIDTLAIDPFTASLSLRNAVIRNPRQHFSDPDFLELNQLIIRINPFRFRSESTKVIDEILLDIEQLTYVKTSENLSNFQAFAAVVQPQLLTDGRLQDEKKGITPSWEVKRLTLRLRTLKETDRSQQPPLIRKMPVAIEHNFQSFNDIQSIIIPLHRSLAAFNATRTLDALISALTAPRKLPMASGSPYSFDNVLPKALDGWENIRRVLQEPLEVPSRSDTP